MTRPARTAGWQLHMTLARLHVERPDAPAKALARAAGCSTETVRLHLTGRCTCSPQGLVELRTLTAT